MRRIVGWLLLMTGPALAQAAPPTDYSPYPEVSIRTLRVEKRSNGIRPVVSVVNSTQDPINVAFECASFTAGGEALSTTSGYAETVPPGQEVAAEGATFKGNADLVRCRVRSISPVR